MKLKEEDFDRILLSRAYGRRPMEIAAELGLSDNAVRNVLTLFETVRRQDWRLCHEMIVSRSLSRRMVEWAADRQGVKIPTGIYSAFVERSERTKALKDRRARAGGDGTEQLSFADAEAQEEDELTKLLRRADSCIDYLEDLMRRVTRDYHIILLEG